MLTQKEINEMRGLSVLKKKGCGNGLVIVRDPRSKKVVCIFTGPWDGRLMGKGFREIAGLELKVKVLVSSLKSKQWRSG